MACSASRRHCLASGCVLVVQRRVRVQVPAVVVEAAGGDQRTDFGRRLVLQIMKADNHVCYLHAGIVDVVLDLDLAPAGAQHAHEGVAQNGVAQVADVRGFVRIDVGVFDDNLARHGNGRQILATQQPGGIGAPVQTQVQKTAARNLDGGDAGDGRQRF